MIPSRVEDISPETPKNLIVSLMLNTYFYMPAWSDKASKGYKKLSVARFKVNSRDPIERYSKPWK